jgi:hypothetical protein
MAYKVGGHNGAQGAIAGPSGTYENHFDRITISKVALYALVVLGLLAGISYAVMIGTPWAIVIGGSVVALSGGTGYAFLFKNAVYDDKSCQIVGNDMVGEDEHPAAKACSWQKWQDLFYDMPQERKVLGRYSQYTVPWNPDEKTRGAWYGLSVVDGTLSWQWAAPRYFCSVAAVNSVRAMLMAGLNKEDDIDRILRESQNMYCEMLLEKSKNPQDYDRMTYPSGVNRCTFLGFGDYHLERFFPDIEILANSADRTEQLIPGINDFVMNKSTRYTYSCLVGCAERSLQAVGEKIGIGINMSGSSYGIVVTKMARNSFKYEFTDSHGEHSFVNGAMQENISGMKLIFDDRKGLVDFLEGHYSQPELHLQEEWEKRIVEKRFFEIDWVFIKLRS